MKKTKFVYVVYSICQNESMIFGTRKRAENWIKHFNEKIFDKSRQKDLYILSRTVF